MRQFGEISRHWGCGRGRLKHTWPKPSLPDVQWGPSPRPLVCTRETVYSKALNQSPLWKRYNERGGREREWERVGVEERESLADFVLSAEPDVGLGPMTQLIMTWAKITSLTLNGLSHSGTLSQDVFKGRWGEEERWVRRRGPMTQTQIKDVTKERRVNLILLSSKRASVVPTGACQLLDGNLRSCKQLNEHLKIIAGKDTIS